VAATEQFPVRILDIHIHVARREHLSPRFVRYFEETFSPELLLQIDDLTPEAFNSFLVQQGVDRGVVLAEYSPEATGVVPSEFVSGFCGAADRLIAFGSLDLTSETDTGLQTEHCVKELGCRGLKLLPSYAHFFPNDARLFPAYEVARDLSIPIMFHTGTSLFPGTKVCFADPLLLDEIAEQFPDLAIVMCHGGRPFWYKQAEWMLARHKNVFIDIAGIPPKQLRVAFPKLEKFPEKFVFGSDWPNIPSIAEQVKKIEQLNLRPETLEGLFWRNGARLLRID
jgi:predicted TIM-barrel fold metal-dependent hydrolase